MKLLLITQRSESSVRSQTTTIKINKNKINLPIYGRINGAGSSFTIPASLLMVISDLIK